jgi:hypothetical protein
MEWRSFAAIDSSIATIGAFDDKSSPKKQVAGTNILSLKTKNVQG